MASPADRTDELTRLRILEEQVRRLRLRIGDPLGLPEVVWGIWGPDYGDAVASDDFSLVELPTEYAIPVDGPVNQEQRPSIWVWPLLGSSGGWGRTFFDSDAEVRPSVVTVPEDGFYVFGCVINDMIPRDAGGNQVGDTVAEWFDPYVYTVKKSDPFGGIIAQYNGPRAHNEQVVVGALDVNRGGIKTSATGFGALTKGDGIGSFFRPQPAPDGDLTGIDKVTWGGVGSAIPLLWAVKVPGPITPPPSPW